MGRKGFETLENLPTAAPKNPVGRSRAVPLSLAALKQATPQPRGVAEHPPVGFHINHAKPRLRQLEGVEGTNFNVFLAIHERAMDDFSGPYMTRAHAERENSDPFRRRHDHVRTPSSMPEKTSHSKR